MDQNEIVRQSHELHAAARDERRDARALPDTDKGDDPGPVPEPKPA